MAKSLRKLMGVGSYTTSGRGTSSYCMSDGVEHCSDADYELVKANLTKALGEPQYVDRKGCLYWFDEKLGLIFLPVNTDAPFKYVELDKSCSMEYFEEFKSSGK